MNVRCPQSITSCLFYTGRAFSPRTIRFNRVYIMKNEYFILDLVAEMPLPFCVLRWIQNCSLDMDWFQIETTPSSTTYIPHNLISFYKVLHHRVSLWDLCSLPFSLVAHNATTRESHPLVRTFLIQEIRNHNCNLPQTFNNNESSSKN